MTLRPKFNTPSRARRDAADAAQRAEATRAGVTEQEIAAARDEADRRVQLPRVKAKGRGDPGSGQPPITLPRLRFLEDDPPPEEGSTS